MVELSDVFDRTGHPCKVDFIAFGNQIGLPASRINGIVTRFSSIPPEVGTLVGRSFLNDKMKRSYLRIVNERVSRFKRDSE